MASFDAVNRRSLLTMSGGLVLGQLAGQLPAGATGSGAGATETGWQSRLVHYDADGRLRYHQDAEQNRIPDFSHAGYRNADQPIPEVPTVRRIGPVEGDNTGHIQAAIDAVGQLPKDPDGLRGAVLLEAGIYPVAGTVRLNHDGVVLRGVGDEVDPASNTVIRAVGNVPEHRDVLVVGGGASTQWRGEFPGTRTTVTSDVVEVGARSFNVADASALSPGDSLILVHPCTAEWLAAIDHGATGRDEPWTVDSQPIVYNRRITEIRGNRITVDVPLFNHLRRDLSPSYVYAWDRTGVVAEVGVEDLRIDIEFAGDPDQDEDHAWVAIKLRQVEDVWVSGCTMLHFAKAGVETDECTRATIVKSRALDPASVVTGGLRYNFNTEKYSQQVLFADCYASRARHAYISNGTSTASGVVFLRGVSEGSLASSEGHRRWSQALLWDNHREVAPATGITLGIYNRGDYGTGHGWASAHSVAWNADMAGRRLVVQRPPTAQNYAIGCAGEVTGDGPFEQPTGHIEGANQPGLVPASLYEAQLADRHR
ncbi:hypothetical protein [Actinopolymorpha sp. B9G3]|uniref:hypothetical protein n=1 Tax=Actinopolymorpha sp. B9G3 TaxID=3158970 RepID=UPI0032D9284C